MSGRTRSTISRVRHIPELDGLRAVAIVLVLGAHSGALRGGVIGVDIFFVISGYLITAILVQEFAQTGNLDIRAFYIRRLLRIGPAFAFMLLSVLAMTALFVLPERRPAQYLPILYAAAYAMNWTRAFGLGSGIIGHTWSLAVEEQFYLVWPLALLGILPFDRRRRIMILLGLVAASALWRGWLTFLPGTEDHVFFGSDTRANQILLGCLLAFLPQHEVARWASRSWAVPALALATLAVMGIPHWLRPGDSVFIGLCAAWLIAAVLDARPTLLATVLKTGFCVAIGRLSYSLYLWHAPIGAALGGRAVAPVAVLQIISLSLSFAAAIFSYFVIEKPFLRLKDGHRLAAAADSPVSP